MIRNNGRGENFCGAGGRCINEHGNRVLPEDLLRLSGEDLCRDGLAAKRGQRARGDEEASDCNGPGNRATAAFAHIQDDLVNALLFRVQQTVADFLGAARIERREAQDENVRVRFLSHDLRCRHFVADDVNFFGRGFAAANNRDLDARARLAIEKIQGLPYGHVTRGESANGFQNVAAANSRLRARTIRQHGENNNVTVALAKRQTSLARGRVR